MKQSDIINSWRQIINPKDADYFKNKLLQLADNTNKLSNDEINNKIEDIANEIEQYRISNKTINGNKINDNFSRDEFGFNKDYFKS